MHEYYLEIRALHITCVLLSGSVFAFRGALMALGSPLSRHVVLRRCSYLNDSILLIAGLLLMWITQQSPLNQGWLALKLGLLPIYIVLGVFALRLGRTQARRMGFFVAALSVYAAMLSVALSHGG